MLKGRVTIVLGCVVIGLSAAFAIYHSQGVDVYEESFEFTYEVIRNQMKEQECASEECLRADRANRRREDIRSLSDCFKDWEYESRTRSRPFYKKVANRLIDNHDPTASQEKINRILKDIRLEILEGADDALPVIARVTLSAEDMQLLKEVASAYKGCMSEYISEENNHSVERATSALLGKYITLQAETNKLARSVGDRNIPEPPKAALLKRKAELNEALSKLEGEIAEAEKIAQKYGRVISFR